MARFYYEWIELDDGSWDYGVFDRQRGNDNYLALCDCSRDAEKIVDALNAVKAVGVFG
jgi:hypothetical protein